MVRSMLEALEEDWMNIDVDHWDPEVAKAMPFKPHNQTSNTLIICEGMKDPRNKVWVDEILKKYKNDGWAAIFDRVAVGLCAQNIGNIQNRVLVQVSCKNIRDKNKTIEHARRYDKYFQEAGISRDRYCIKIPICGPAMAAARVLNTEGIRTLGTALFGLCQAIAAAQAGSIMVSPYYNECAAHNNLDTIWPNCDDPEFEHYHSFRIRQYIEAYQAMYNQGKEVPKVMSASYISSKEIIASAKLGVWAVTLFPVHLKELAETPENAPVPDHPKASDPYKLNKKVPEKYAHMSKADPAQGKDWDGVLASIDTDYLANDGAALDEAMKKDKVIPPRFKDAMDLFSGAETEAQEWIEARLKELA